MMAIAKHRQRDDRAQRQHRRRHRDRRQDQDRERVLQPAGQVQQHGQLQQVVAEEERRLALAEPAGGPPVERDQRG